MNFGEVIKQAQQKGYGQLKDCLDRHRAAGDEVFAEPALRNASGEIVSAPDGLKLPLRSDLAFFDSTGTVKTEYADTYSLNFREPVFANWENKLKIEIHSVSWDYMAFHLPPVNMQNSWEGLRRWFLRWFDFEDEKTADSNGLYGVVHFISDPEVEAEGVSLRVDFGSAPIDALGELFDELIKLGVTYCTIGTPADPKTFQVTA